MCGGQQLYEYAPTVHACTTLYQFVILNCTFYFLWFSLIQRQYNQIQFPCGRTHSQNAGVEKLAYVPMPTQFFSFSQNILSTSSQEKGSFLLLSIKWLFGRNQNSFRKARLRNIFPRQYIASYKHPIRFYLREKKKKHHMDCLVFIKLWHHSLARQLKKGTGTRSWLMFPLVCIVTSSVNFLGQKGTFLCLISIKS